MSNLNRRGFLLLGLVSFLGVMLAGFWRLWRQYFQPGHGTESGTFSDNQDIPNKEKPNQGLSTQSPGDSTSQMKENEPGENGPGLRDSNEEGENAQGCDDLQPSSWKRPLGKTGVTVSLFGLGGGGMIARGEQKDAAIELIHRALDLGVNYIDTAPTYGNSEEHIGEVLKDRRKEVFLATKTLDRTYDGTMRLMEQSLKDLQTETVDLYQVHGIRDQEDVQGIFKTGGVLEAMEKLKSQGVVRYIGITGHRNPEPLRYALERFDFDCVLMPLNPAEVHFQSFQESLLPLALQKQVGIIAMKVPAYGRLLREGGIESMEQALRYVYTLPISTAIVGLSSMNQLEENLRITRDYSPYSAEEMEALESLARPYQEEANFYKVQW